MPVVITFVVPVEDELVTFIVDGAFAGTWISAILLLIFRIQLGVEHRYFHFMAHSVW